MIDFPPPIARGAVESIPHITSHYYQVCPWKHVYQMKIHSMLFFISVHPCRNEISSDSSQDITLCPRPVPHLSSLGRTRGWRDWCCFQALRFLVEDCFLGTTNLIKSQSFTRRHGVGWATVWKLAAQFPILSFANLGLLSLLSYLADPAIGWTWKEKDRSKVVPVN